jgi:hypothetical protein
MKKFPVTIWIFVGLCAASVAAFGTALRDTVAGLMVQSNLCKQGDILCVLRDTSIFIVVVLSIVFLVELLAGQRGDWHRVKFTRWMPVIDHEVLGGITIQNDTDTDLEECRAALIGCHAAASTPSIEAMTENPGSSLTDRLLPSTLFWSVGGKLQTEVDIGRGKEGYLAIGYPIQKSEAQATGREFIYKIKTVAVELIHPVSRGYIDIRINAKVNSKSIAAARKSVRIEVTDKTLFFREVLDTRRSKKNQRSPLGGTKAQPGIQQ